jgi:hypothetical protein
MAKKKSARVTTLPGGNPDDAIRDAILRHLYDVHKKAKGPASAAIGIRDLQSALRKSHGYKQQQVGSNLDYLVQKEWVTEVVRERSFRTKGGTTQSAQQVKYKISHLGIDKLQKASLYQRTPIASGINITNIHGVTVVGDGNVVNTSFTDLSRVLNDLKAEVQNTTKIGDDQKLNVIADIDTLQAQLQKPEPNRSIIGTLWSGIEKAVTAAGLVDITGKVASLITPLLL